MKISFTKGKSNNHIISCKRDDGTITWMHIDSFFVTHDICHYAVEKGLALQNAFYGMLASGTDINDFELPKAKRTFELTDQAVFTEQIVNLLTIEHSQGRMNNFVDVLNEVCKGNTISLSLSPIVKENLEQIRHSFETLINQWDLLPEEKSMTLIFEK